MRQVHVPWAQEGSYFRLLFEAYLITLVPAMPVAVVAERVRETDRRIWRIVRHYVEKAPETVDMNEVDSVGVDETSNRRGHDYRTWFVDLSEKRLLFATEGKNLKDHGGEPDAIKNVRMDLSPAL